MKEKIPATLESVSNFNQTLETYLREMPIEDRTALVLAVQELLVNIVRHAYGDVTGFIHFNMEQSNNSVIIMVRDNAQQAFVMPKTIDPPDPLDLPEGGMGLFIIHQVFDLVEYERLPDGNRWHLRKESNK